MRNPKCKQGAQWRADIGKSEKRFQMGGGDRNKTFVNGEKRDRSKGGNGEKRINKIHYVQVKIVCDECD